jgi:hypothetical protein
VILKLYSLESFAFTTEISLLITIVLEVEVSKSQETSSSPGVISVLTFSKYHSILAIEDPPAASTEIENSFELTGSIFVFANDCHNQDISPRTGAVLSIFAIE